MKATFNLEKVWRYIDVEWDETLGRPPNREEAVTIVLVVSALTKMLADTWTGSSRLRRDG